ncbi:hypothetical protein P9209_06350 [Prescottella defluvii]|nr:hypothetical protein P9209_06350 [Prescottella defluvii]
MRTAFPIGDDGPVQDVRASAGAGIVLEPIPVAESEVPDRVRAVATAGFDVTEEVPVRGSCSWSTRTPTFWCSWPTTS